MTKKTFTLLELVIVLLIIGALATLSIEQYMDSQVLTKMRIFEENVNKITKTLSVYKSNSILYGNQTNSYPISLVDSQFKALFKQEPKNPYTNKPMLSDNPADSGIQYVSDGTSYKLCVVQRDVDDVNNNGVVEEVLPLSTKTACIGNTQTSVGVTFARNSVAYTSDGAQVAANQPRFEQGQFGQAVLVEERTTNLNSDPFFKTGVSGWGVGTWTTLEWLSSEYNPFSKQNGVMRLYDNDGDKGYCSKVVSISNTPHTVSVLLKILKGNINNINVGGTIYYTDSTYTDYTWNDSNTTRYDMSAIFGQGVYKLVATITPNSSKTISKYEIRISHNSAVETELLVYAIQLEQKPYATSFINGTRYPETLTIPTASVLNPQEGTVEFWWMPINQPASTIVSQQTSPPIFEIGTYWQPNSLILWVYAGAGLRLLVRGNEATIWTGDWTIISGFNWYQLNCWYHIALRWQNGNTFYVFVNGVKYGPYVSSLPLTSIAGNIMSLGKLNASSGGSNALFDDLRISSRARTDEEIAAAYQSGQPLPVDAWTTLKLDFNGDLSTQSGVIP